MEIKNISLDCLPFEVIEYILDFRVVSCVDLCRFSNVCQLFNSVAKSNKLWRNKYMQMWPNLVQSFDVHQTDWKHEFQLRHTFKKTVAKKLKELSSDFYFQDNVSNDAFKELEDLSGFHEYGQNIIIDELQHIINDKDEFHNLTLKYYAKRALRFMQHKYLEKVWKDFLLLQPSNNSVLIEGACLVSQWCQPTRVNCTAEVPFLLNSMTERVFEKVREKSPRHPLLKRGILSTGDVLGKSLWTPSECRTVLCCINTVMFEEMKFCGNKDDFYCADNTFIDKVMTRRTGIPITLGIVYGTIAARLGVNCLPVNFPGHFLLKWLEHPQFDSKEAYTFIDVFEGGAFKSWKDVFDLVPGYQNIPDLWFEAVEPVKVFARMCWNLVEVGRQLDGVGDGLLCLCNALELLSILCPDDMEHKLLLARVYMHLAINVTDVIALLQEIASHDPMSSSIVGYMYQSALTTLETQKTRQNNQKKKCQLRNDAKDVKYAVGMIMRHKKYNYRCVIYGWDGVCTASTDWIKQMGVYNLPNKDKQPFYHVLVEDGTNRYAAQENLEMDDTNEPICHIEVGRYFDSFHGRYYMPNEQKGCEYPQDIQAFQRALSESN